MITFIIQILSKRQLVQFINSKYPHDHVHNSMPSPSPQKEQGLYYEHCVHDTWYNEHCVHNTNSDSRSQNQLHCFHATMVGPKTFWGDQRAEGLRVVYVGKGVLEGCSKLSFWPFQKLNSLNWPKCSAFGNRAKAATLRIELKDQVTKC